MFRQHVVDPKTKSLQVPPTCLTMVAPGGAVSELICCRSAQLIFNVLALDRNRVNPSQRN